MVQAFVVGFNHQLAVSLPLEKGEAGASFLSRLAEANWYRDESWIRELASGPSGPDGYWNSEQIERLAGICGLPASRLEQSFQMKRGEGVAYLGQVLPVSQVERTRLKVCPSCLAEHGCHHAVFDLASVTVCPKHRSVLRHTCSECRAPLSRKSPSLFHCEKCADDLRQQDTDKEPNEECLGAWLIAQKADFPLGSGTALVDVGRFNEIFDRPGLHDTIRLLESLGRIALSPKHYKGWPAPAIASRVLRHRWIAAGGAMVVRWPEAFYETLDEVAASGRAEHGRTAGLRREFDAVYEYLMGSCGEWPAIAAAFVAYLATRWDGFLGPRRRNSRVPKGVDRSAKYISSLDLARLPGMGSAKARTIVEAIGEEAVNIPVGERSQHQFTFLPTEAVRRYIPLGRPPLGVRAMSTRIGLSGSIVKRLADGGFLWHHSWIDARGCKRYRICPDFADVVIGKLEAVADEKPRSSDLIGFGALLKAQAAREQPLDGVMKHVQDKRIGLTLVPGSGPVLSRMRFCRHEVREILGAEPIRRSGIEALTREEACRRLGVRKDSLAWLVSSGRLAAAEGKGMFSLIDAQSLASFMSEWQKLGDIAARYRTNRSLMRRALESSGVFAIGGEGEIARFYRRADLRDVNVSEALDAAALFKGKAPDVYAKGLAARSATRCGLT